MTSQWQPPDDIDPQCLAICTVLNQWEGVQTRKSSCGHGTGPFRVFFEVDSLDVLWNLTAQVWAICKVKFGDEFCWQIISSHGPSGRYLFRLEGPPGDFEAANIIARGLKPAAAYQPKNESAME